jgi:hypothetical protein
MTTYDRRSNDRMRRTEKFQANGLFYNDQTSEEFYDDYVRREAMNGADMPNYKAVIKSGSNATNYAFAFRRSVTSQQGSARTTTVSRGYIGDYPDWVYQETQRSTYTTSGVLVVAPGPGEPILAPEAEDQAKAKFVSKVRERMSPAAMGATLGELRETINMIRRPAQALRNGISNYLGAVKKRSKGLKKASTTKKNSVVSGTWLEYSLGWRPLLYDIDNIAEALALYATQTRSIDKIRSQSTLKVVNDSYESTVGGGGSEMATYSVTTTGSSKVALYGGIRLAAGSSVSAPSAFGLRPTDFIPTIWELIPYSFVIDYFTNIGDIISTSTFASSDLAWHGMSTLAKNETKCHGFRRWGHDVYGENLDSFGSISPGESIAKYEKFERSDSPTLSVPRLHFKLPGSPNAYFNIAALVSQARSIRI